MQHKQGPGGKASKTEVCRLLTTKELYVVVQEAQGSIVSI